MNHAINHTPVHVYPSDKKNSNFKMRHLVKEKSTLFLQEFQFKNKEILQRILCIYFYQSIKYALYTYIFIRQKIKIYFVITCQRVFFMKMLRDATTRRLKTNAVRRERGQNKSRFITLLQRCLYDASLFLLSSLPLPSSLPPSLFLFLVPTLLLSI